MLHRSSNYGTVSNNEVYNNGDAGMALFESSHNKIYDNTFTNNRREYLLGGGRGGGNYCKVFRTFIVTVDVIAVAVVILVVAAALVVGVGIVCGVAVFVLTVYSLIFAQRHTEVETRLSPNPHPKPYRKIIPTFPEQLS